MFGGKLRFHPDGNFQLQTLQGYKLSMRTRKGEVIVIRINKKSCPHDYLKQGWQISIHNNTWNVHMGKGIISWQSLNQQFESVILKSILSLLK